MWCSSTVSGTVQFWGLVIPLSEGLCGSALFWKLFQDFRAAGTSFGPASSRALLHAVPVDVASISKNHALQTLDLDKCFGIFSTVVFCTSREISRRKFAAGFTGVCWCSCNMMYNSVFYTEKKYSHSAPFTHYVPTYRMSWSFDLLFTRRVTPNTLWIFLCRLGGETSNSVVKIPAFPGLFVHGLHLCQWHCFIYVFWNRSTASQSQRNTGGWVLLTLEFTSKAFLYDLSCLCTFWISKGHISILHWLIWLPW